MATSKPTSAIYIDHANHGTIWFHISIFIPLRILFPSLPEASWNDDVVLGPWTTGIRQALCLCPVSTAETWQWYLHATPVHRYNKKNGSGVRPRLWDETVKQKMRDPPMLACLLGWDRCLRRNSVRYQDSDEKPRTEAISQCAKVERLATNKQAQCLYKFLTMINRQL